MTAKESKKPQESKKPKEAKESELYKEQAEQITQVRAEIVREKALLDEAKPNAIPSRKALTMAYNALDVKRTYLRDLIAEHERTKSTMAFDLHLNLPDPKPEPKIKLDLPDLRYP